MWQRNPNSLQHLVALHLWPTYTVQTAILFDLNKYAKYMPTYPLLSPHTHTPPQHVPPLLTSGPLTGATTYFSPIASWNALGYSHVYKVSWSYFLDEGRSKGLTTAKNGEKIDTLHVPAIECTVCPRMKLSKFRRHIAQKVRIIWQYPFVEQNVVVFLTCVSNISKFIGQYIKSKRFKWHMYGTIFPTFAKCRSRVWF